MSKGYRTIHRVDPWSLATISEIKRSIVLSKKQKRNYKLVQAL